MQRSLVLCVATLLSASLTGSPAPSATLTFNDGICEQRVVYDAKKVDSQQLKASFDYLAGDENTIQLPPTFSSPEDIAAIDIAEYHQRCVSSHQRLAALSLIALPGLDDLRRREVGELDETCARTEAMLAAAKGDMAPARAYAAACTRYADLLALPTSNLKAQWNDLVSDLCQASTERNVCAGELQRRGEGPGSETRRRIAVLTRWSECAVKPNSVAAGEKQKLLETLAKRYKVKAASCAQ